MANITNQIGSHHTWAADVIVDGQYGVRVSARLLNGVHTVTVRGASWSMTNTKNEMFSFDEIDKIVDFATKTLGAAK